MSYLSLSPPSTPSRQKNKYNSGTSGSSSSKNTTAAAGMLPQTVFSPSSSSAKGVSWTNPMSSGADNFYNSARDRGGSMSAPSSPNPKRIKDNNSSQPGTPTRGTSGLSSQMSGVTVSGSDRYIANRASVDFDYCNSILSKAICDENNYFDNQHGMAGSSSNSAGSVSKRYNRSNIGLREFYMANGLSAKRLMSCFDAPPPMTSPRLKVSSALSVVDRESAGSASPATSPAVAKRSLPTGPSRILDAPELEDDYYLNLLHWGANNVVAVALRNTVYLWHAETGRIDQLPTLSTDSDCIVTSVQWAADGSDVLAVGTSSNAVQLWDCKTSTKIRELEGHSQRVSALSWSKIAGGHSLSSGSRDSSILNYDTRQARPIVSKFSGHLQEVCGLTWNDEGTTLASGGNENLLCLFDSRWGGSSPQRRRSEGGDPEEHSARLIIEQHHAAVKALAWCPFQRNVLASGGGTADRTLRIWNTTQGTNIKTVDTGSQVCSIQWSDTYKELVSSHGFSDNQLILWRYPTMQKTHEFTGHVKRVLHMAKSPDGSTICSASADETLRFWDLFSCSSTKASSTSSGSSYLTNNMLLR